LNSQITRYNADDTYTVNDVLEACERGENIIFQDGTTSAKRPKPK